MNDVHTSASAKARHIAPTRIGSVVVALLCLAGSGTRGIASGATAAAGPPADREAAALVVESSRALASLPGAAGTVIYVTVRNDGDRADRLVAAATPAAGMVHLHAGTMQNGVSSMRPSDGFDVPAHGRLQLTMGGDHLMLMGLVRPLVAGSTLALTLTFARAGDVKVSVPVVAATGN